MPAADESTIQDILYVRFRVTDLERQRRFLKRFGFAVEKVGDQLIARGTDADRYIYVAEQGDTPAFLALGFSARSMAALEAIAAHDHVAIEPNDLPGGGCIARLTDPNGNGVEVVFGVDPVPAIETAERSGFNTGDHKARLGERASLPESPTFVKRLGHAVLFVNDFHETFAWYQQRFGLLISDEIVDGEAGDEQTIGAFTRCNLGDAYVDHHTLFFIHAGHSAFNHAAFEVKDWDVLMKSHFDLQRAGYTHSHGIGKHLLGSQVYDYWKDEEGFVLEHFTDGDLFNESFGSHKRPVADLLANLWGPDGAPG